MSQTLPSLSSLEPARVWHFFSGLAAVPRPSKKEEKIRAHVTELARSLGFEVDADGTGNLVVRVPATPGHEQSPVTVIQGHLDMVCERNSETEHDFDNEGIHLIVDRDAETGQMIVRGDGTTLGADNGIGVSLAFAAATDPEVIHGPLEILCTADEEMGMTGAKALEPEFMKGRRMLNLDSEEDDALYIGCAGGCDVNLSWEIALDPVAASDEESCQITVSGLRGGHSGCDIHLNRTNAIKALVATLRRGAGERLRLAMISGGSKRNAIPREASAVVVGPAGTTEALREAAGAVRDAAIRDHGEEKTAIDVQTTTRPERAASTEATARLLGGLAALPHGVLAVVPDIPGLVQTSSSLSTITAEVTGGGSGLSVLVGCLTRGSCDSEMWDAVDQVSTTGTLAGAQVQSGNSYPGWQPDTGSPLLATCKRLYHEVFGEEPAVTAIHAGLECGIIGERMGGMDMISFGPNIRGAHSPEERVYVDSVRKSWEYLKKVLAELAKG